MNVSKYGFEDGKWIEIVVDSAKELEPFRFKVQPVGEAALAASFKRSDVITTIFIEAVVDWDLLDGATKLPCTAEAKQKYLPIFACYKVRSVDGVEEKEEANLALVVARFAQQPDNFLKN